MKTYLNHLLVVFLVFLLLGSFIACDKQVKSETVCTNADSLVFDAIDSADFGRLKMVADEQEKAGNISSVEACRWRGDALGQLGRLAESEEEYKKGMAIKTLKTLDDSISFIGCVGGYVQFAAMRREHDEVLQTVVPILDMLKTMTVPPKDVTLMCQEKMMLYMYLGNSQYFYDKTADAEKSFENAFRAACELAESEESWSVSQTAALAMHNVTTVYLAKNAFDVVPKWLGRADSLVQFFYHRPDAPESYVGLMKALLDIDHAMLSLGQNRIEEANNYYESFSKSAYAQTTTDGRFKVLKYLRKAKRYAEAADAYQCWDEALGEYRLAPSVDFIDMIVGKYEVNLKAGRIDSALVAATYAFEYIDSALVRERRSEAAKLATIYETKQKDEEIAQQQIDLSHQRFVALAVVLVLLVIFFVIYTIVRRRAERRLAAMRAAQERMESELRIARDIQMSMVPSTFPEREGLDLYASMSPAKEVGGDLYGYVINGHNLYFTVGDVSGKGVPASLFMAQATRLFHTMASQGLLPADICTQMNVELSGEDNTNGMFVTMFIGMLDMETGHLVFCNAGHNPPVVGGGEHHGEFLEMIPNAPIGLWPDLKYKGEEIDSVKGRALFVYTDGLNEAENTSQQQFGDERLLAILRNTHFDSARQVVDTLYAEVEKHRAGAEPNDDLTMLCLRVS